MTSRLFGAHLPCCVRFPLILRLKQHALSCVRGRCHIAGKVDDGPKRAGAMLFDALAAQDLPEGVSVTPVECISNCSRGCTVALRGDDCWTYIYGHFEGDKDVDKVMEGVSAYHGTSDGLIPWRERPEHLKRNCVARLPALTPKDPS